MDFDQHSHNKINPALLSLKESEQETKLQL